MKCRNRETSGWGLWNFAESTGAKKKSAFIFHSHFWSEDGNKDITISSRKQRRNLDKEPAMTLRKAIYYRTNKGPRAWLPIHDEGNALALTGVKHRSTSKKCMLTQRSAYTNKHCSLLFAALGGVKQSHGQQLRSHQCPPSSKLLDKESREMRESYFAIETMQNSVHPISFYFQVVLLARERSESPFPLMASAAPTSDCIHVPSWRSTFEWGSSVKLSKFSSKEIEIKT